MTYRTTNKKAAHWLPALALCAALGVPAVAAADPVPAAGLKADFGAVKVHDRGYRHRHDHGLRRDHRFDRHRIRGSRSGYHPRYFARPFEPLNFKHWRRVERQFGHYTPNLSHLNRYERREVLGHSYNRYLRDHRRWSERRAKRSYRDRRWSRHDRPRDRWLTRNHHHNWRNCNDRSHRHGRYRRW